MALATKELLWLSHLLQDLDVEVKLTITLCTNSRSTQLIVRNLCLHGQEKYIEVDAHFTRDHVVSGFLMFLLVYNLQMCLPKQ